MEPEDLSERIEWQTRRVAAAFGVKEWGQVTEEVEHGVTAFTGLIGEQKVTWAIMDRTGLYAGVGVTNFDSDDSYVSVVQNNEGAWYTGLSSNRHNELMVRGLYRLGFEDEGVLAELNHPLTAHEKLELRFSLPREFWPQRWRDEEQTSRAL